ncbi:hypothetical protein E4633_07930 [Geomonas terrae]|jgi:hypothetical protein|uniref:Uncharacterized protein n=1 Tax=Geomonas terrae TaxID=2562681 RepID=A0A4S1CFX2_9BACT|nr:MULTISPECIES: hypothetical protein [Geomonas]TGU72233.1 hypothetical protein E4633_07930 [Geomonas terrae]TSK08940.1 MAG: hypothetical protein FPO08_06490 [Geobacter sp.]
MGYLSYGHEFILSIVLLLVVLHFVLDLLPMLYSRVRLLFASTPVRITSGLVIIIAAFFLL